VTLLRLRELRSSSGILATLKIIINIDSDIGTAATTLLAEVRIVFCIDHKRGTNRHIIVLDKPFPCTYTIPRAMDVAIIW